MVLYNVTEALVVQKVDDIIGQIRASRDRIGNYFDGFSDLKNDFIEQGRYGLMNNRQNAGKHRVAVNHGVDFGTTFVNAQMHGRFDRRRQTAFYLRYES